MSSAELADQRLDRLGCDRQTDLEDIIQAAPNVMPHRTTLFSQLEDSDTGEDFLSFRKSPGVRIDESTVCALEGCDDAGKILDTSC